MKIILLVLLLAVTSLNCVLGQSEYDIFKTPCSTNGTLINYNMYSQNIAQFFSPNFPQNLIINNSVMTSCQARFFTVINDQRIWMAIYNGVINSFQIYDDNNNGINFDTPFNSNDQFVAVASTSHSLTFGFNTEKGIATDWTAFEGVVIAYDPSVQCPFSGQSIGFDNVENTLVIPIASDFGTKNTNTKCHWSFNTYFGQYLKIVIQKLVLNENVTFELQQNGVTIKQFVQNVSQPEAFYFISDAGSFTLIYNDTNEASAGTFFKALVSDATFPTSTTTSQCLASTSDGSIQKISNLDYKVGYQRNQNCEHEIITKENEEYLLDVTVFHIEKNVDILSMNVGTQKYRLSKSSHLRLTKFANNSVISFAADPSVQQVGFEITLKTLDCTCPDYDIIVPCDSAVKLMPLEDQSTYCDGMKCNYTIYQNSSCLEKGFQMHLEARFRTNVVIDYMNLYTNGTLREGYEDYVDLPRHFSGDTEIIIEFISGTLDTAIKRRNGNWMITLESEAIPEINATMLSEEMPYKVVKQKDFLNEEVITVCSPENDQLELIVATTSGSTEYLKNYALYDGKELENFVGSLDLAEDTSNLGRIISSTNCFTVYRSFLEDAYDPLFVILFRMKNTQSQNCESNENIMLLSDELQTFNNSAVSNGSCEMIILTPWDFPFSIKIDSMDGTFNNEFVLKAASNQNVFAKINSSEFSQWHNVILSTPALSIEIPSSTYFSMEAIASRYSFVHVVANPQKGILVSPNFGGLFNNPSDNVYRIELYNNDQYITAEFVLRSKQGIEDLQIESDFNNKNQSLTTPGEKVSVNGTFFQLYTKKATSNDDSFLIEYSLTINDVLTSTTLTTTTLTTTTTPTTVTTSTSTTFTSPTPPPLTTSPTTTSTLPSSTTISTTTPTAPISSSLSPTNQLSNFSSTSTSTSTMTSTTTTTTPPPTTSHGTSNMLPSLGWHFIFACLVLFGF